MNENRKLIMEYKGEPADMDMFDCLLSCFNQDITIKELREILNIGMKKCINKKS